MKNTIVGIVIGVIAIGFVFLIFDARESMIKDKVSSVGGELVSCETRIVNHPFGFVPKGAQVYQFKYMLRGQAREGFVKFSLSTDWRM